MPTAPTSNGCSRPRKPAKNCAAPTLSKSHNLRAEVLVVSWLICNGRLRVHAINAIGQRKGRIIEIEDVDTGERVHGSARRLERLVQVLRRASGEADRISPWTPDRTS